MVPVSGAGTLALSPIPQPSSSPPSSTPPFRHPGGHLFRYSDRNIPKVTLTLTCPFGSEEGHILGEAFYVAIYYDIPLARLKANFQALVIQRRSWVDALGGDYSEGILQGRARRQDTRQGNYIRPWLAKLVKVSSPMMMWSRTLMPIISPASLSLLVMERSSLLGVGSFVG